MSDPVVTERRVSVDFTLSRVRPVAIDGAGSEVHFIPLAFMKKRPMVKFSIFDEAGRVLPILTYHRNGALSLSVVVVLGELLARFPAGPGPGEGPMPEDVISDLTSIVIGDPLGDDELRACIENQPCRPQMSAKSIAWRDFLAGDEEFMKVVGVFSRRFLLAVPLVGKAGVRRVIKYSFEEHGSQPKIRLPIPLRWAVQGWARVVSGKKPPEKVKPRVWSLWLLRGIGWKPMASAFKAPLMGHAGRYHFEVEAPEGLQITLAQLKTETRLNKDGEEEGGDLIDECATSRQRVHLYSRVAKPGIVVVAARPRPFTIIRTGLIASFLSAVVLAVVFVFADRLLQNIGPAVSVLLLAPALLAAYIARPIDQPATNEAVFGLRMMTAFSGLWPLLAALTLAGGTNCKLVAAKPGEAIVSTCESWSMQSSGLLALLILSILNFLLLLAYMTRVNRPPEQQRVEVAINGADAPM